MDRSQDNQARYQAQKDRYLDERAEYNYDRSHPYAWWHERYERATLNHFYDIPRAELIDLRVLRDDGFMLGRIREVDRHPDGRVAAVQIVFRNGDSVWVKAHNLRYDIDDHLVFTDLSYPEIRELERNSRALRFVGTCLRSRYRGQVCLPPLVEPPICPPRPGPRHPEGNNRS